MSNFFYKCIFLLCLFAIGSGATALANNEEGGKDSEPKKIEITGEPLSKKDVKSYLKLADYLFDLGKYYDAKDYYIALYNHNNADIHSAYRTAECYRLERYYSDALYYYEIAIREAVTEDYPLMRYWAARMLMATEEYDRAGEFFNLFLNSYKGEDTYYKDRAIELVKACDMAPELIYNPIDAEIVNLGEKINTKNSENGAFMKDEYIMVFAGTEMAPGLEKVKIKGGGEGSYDSLPSVRLFQTINRKGEWKKREVMYIPVDEIDYHIGAPSFNSDQSKLFFTIYAEGTSRIYYSQLGDDGEWMPPVHIKKMGSSACKYPSVFTGQDGGEYLLFSSDLEDGFGGFDIYVAKLSGEEVGEIINLGENVNTSENEVTPFYMEEDSTLYFSSDGHPGLGELDIFRIKGDPTGALNGKVENVGYPINTGSDDYYYSQFAGEEGNRIGFISSNRPNGNSIAQNAFGDDIYSYSWQEIINTAMSVNFFILKDGTQNPLAGVKVQVWDADADTLVGEVVTGEDGKVGIDLEAKRNYRVKVSKKAFITRTGEIDTKDFQPGDIIDANFPLIEIVLPIIYFEFDRSSITKMEAAKLDKLITLLKEMPETVLEVNAHTDSKGSDAYNMVLSEKRAKSVIDYMVKNGIDKGRLEGTWEGEKSPMVTNDLEEGRKHNRRAEFELFGDDGESIQRSGKIDFKLKTPAGKEIAESKEDDGSDPDTGEINYDDEFRAFKKMLKNFPNKTVEGLEFKVQIGAYYDPGQQRFKHLSVYEEIQVERKDEKIYRFVVVGESGIGETEQIRQKMIGEGIKDAFIAPYKNGKRVRMVDALKMLE